MNHEPTIDREQQLVEHRRPDGTDDATVAAVGKLSEALEKVEEARGHLYAFHRLCGVGRPHPGRRRGRTARRRPS